KAITDELRQTTDKQQQNEIKASKLDYVTFSGIFTERATTGLLQHSNLLCIDLDNLNNVDEVKNKVIELLPPSMMFKSPTNNGIKIVYKINIEQAEHLQYFKAFEQFFKTELNLNIDDKCKDLPRACFLCYDSEAYFNSQAEIIDKSFIDTFYHEPEKVLQIEYKALNTQAINDYSIIMERVKTWLNKKESYVNGNRHGYLTKLAGAYNRYGVPQNLAENDVVSFCQSDCKQTDLLNIVKGIYKRTDWHNTAEFEINAPYDFTVDEVEVKPETKEPTPLLPINGFPDYLQGFINEYVDVYNVPRDYIAASVIFSTALAIGNKLELKGKYDNIPLLWLAIVGNVSSGKTEPLKTCLSYFTNKDKAAFKEYQTNLSIYNAYNELSK
ncbi:MAG TPA: BT4734/BF3469 family protein, partial [Vicingus sp.]|nr:BT4734/BF3469 family protein [Vicingus sp.]